MTLVIHVDVKPTSRSVPVETFVGVPSGSQPGQFLGHGNTWQYPDASATTITKIAQDVLSGHHAVYSFSSTHVAYADQSNLAQVRKLLGVTTGAATAGSDITIQDSGLMVESGWNWSEGDIWLGSNGQLTQTPLSNGYLYRIGVAISPTVMQLNLEFIAQLST